MVAIPLYFFDAKQGIHPKYKHFEEKNKIIDLNVEPHNFVLSSSASFYDTNLFKKLVFDEKLSNEEDTKLNFTLFIKNPKFGYVCENDCKYMYRKRAEQSSVTDNAKSFPRTYFASINLLDTVLKAYEVIPDFVKELIIYELRFRLRSLKPDIFDNIKDYNYVLKKYRKYISSIDKKFIIYTSKWIETKATKYAFLSNAFETTAFTYKDGFVNSGSFKLFSVSKIEINVRQIKYTDKHIIFEITYPNYFVEDLDLIVMDHKNNIFKHNFKEISNGAYDIKYGDKSIFNTIKFIIKVPIHQSKLHFYFYDNKLDQTYSADFVKYPINTPFVLRDKRFKIFLKNYTVSFYQSGVLIKKRTTRSKKFELLSSIRYNIRTYRYIKRKYMTKQIFRLLNFRKKKYILINDRPEKASDNGEAFFKYLVSHDKKLARRTYFVTSKESSDYKKLKKIGKVVNVRSFRHKFMYLNAEYIFSSHLFLDFYCPFDEKEREYYADLFRFKFIFLQHGISKNDLSLAIYKYKNNIDYIVTSTEAEYKEFSKPAYLFNKEDVLLTGISRFDYLTNHPQNIISIIPTWRAYLTGKILSNGFHEKMNNFEYSNYYQNYSKLLSSKRLEKLLKKHKYQLNFILHPGMNAYYDSFKKLETEYINIVPIEDVNYTNIFAESKLLITDYSSIFYDFGYLKKPLIFYQFDKESFYGKHYKKGDLDYEDDGFGDVIRDTSDVISKVEYYFNNKFRMEKKYIDRVNNTFKFKDQKNSERLYNIVFKK